MPAAGARREVRRYLADTFALVVFSVAVGAFVEIVIAGLTFEQSARVRAAAIPVALLTGRPYGIYRDWLFRLLARNGTEPCRAVLIDTLANLSFQVPLYAAILAWNGASLQQISMAAGSILLLLALTGRPYGVFLMWCRKFLGVDRVG
ncbi:L-alanine exporter AlaE [Roseomonas marmotae]|uniref:L-alanine exporter AlaE n=1 Tax=Roseomonas marmotae TaxID=2768161 RepID=A0ABS3KDG4_9PROT|nr:L-alanine exporter AlaE [Roseomonas marmotae]MBO1075511.1 L-alanine exporter AlaE [Roseomonas marmotae]QTI81454.1 L-alanine exporter AlaE [Roseomonas marmotae]